MLGMTGVKVVHCDCDHEMGSVVNNSKRDSLLIVGEEVIYLMSDARFSEERMGFCRPTMQAGPSIRQNSDLNSTRRGVCCTSSMLPSEHSPSLQEYAKNDLELIRSPLGHVPAPHEGLVA